MSFEQLLLLVIILLPLLQLLRAAFQRNRRTPEQAEEQPASAPQPLMWEPQPPAPPGPAIAHRPFSDAITAPERTPAPEVTRRVAPSPAIQRKTRRRTVVANLRNPRSLRRAIVLMTILGPCRASRP